MKIEAGEASRIYFAVKQMTENEPTAKQVVDDIFKKAAKIRSYRGEEEGVLLVSEAEAAQRVIEAADKDNNGKINREEAQNAYNEINRRYAENLRFNTCYYLPQERNLACYQDFVRDFPHSSLTESAQEEISRSSPEQKIQALEEVTSDGIDTFHEKQLEDLFVEYRRIGNNEKALEIIDKLIKIYHDHDWETNRLAQAQLDKAQILLELERLIEAITIAEKYTQNSEYKYIARGIIYSARPGIKKWKKDWIKYIASYWGEILEDRAEYYKFWKSDTRRASEIYHIMAEMPASNIRERGRVGIATIRIEEAESFEQMMQVVAEVEREGKLGSLLQHYSALGAPPPMRTTRTLFVIHGIRKYFNIKDIKASVAFVNQPIDGETKERILMPLIIFRINGTWNMIAPEEETMHVYCSGKKDLKEALSGWRVSFPGLLEKDPIDVPLLDLASNDYERGGQAVKFKNFIHRDLMLQALDDTRERVLDELKQRIKISSAAISPEKISEIAMGLALLPDSHFRGISLDVEPIPKGSKIGGKYPPGSHTPIVYTDRYHTKGATIHEVIHRWDIDVERGDDGNSQTIGDVSLIFYSLNWKGVGLNSEDADWHVYDDAIDDDFKILSSDLFSRYRRKDGFEDLASSGAYYTTNGDELRYLARELMKKGNFIPAAHYLFHKYVRSHDKLDGLCLEYGLDGDLDVEPLSIREVKRELERWRKQHGSNPRLGRAGRAIDEIDRIHRVRPFAVLGRVRPEGKARALQPSP